MIQTLNFVNSACDLLVFPLVAFLISDHLLLTIAY